MSKTAATKAPEGTEAISNDTFIVDNTDIVEVAVVTVETEEVEILNGLTQVNYL